MSPSCVGEQRKLGRKYLHSNKKMFNIKEKQWVLGSFFDPGTPYTFLPNTCHLCQTSCSAFSSLRKTYGKKSLHGGGKQGSCNTSKRGCNSCLMVSICFNMIIWFNMVQNLGDFLSYQTGLSAFDVNFCLHIVTSLQLWCLFLSRAESHLIDDLFMTSFTACCKWSPWMFKVFDRVTKKRRSPDLLLKQKMPILSHEQAKRQRPCGHLSLVESGCHRRWLVKQSNCQLFEGFFWGLGSLGECLLGELCI